MRISRHLTVLPAVMLAVMTTGMTRPQAGTVATAVTAAWVQEQALHTPPPRMLTGGQLAFDSADQTAVFFGGEQSEGGDLPDDTWVHSAADWASPSPAVHPDARVVSPMVYDPVRNQTVMFGGTADYLGFGKRDTWIWDGTSWQLRHPKAAPLPRAHPGMAWDPVHNRVLLYGGFELDNGRWLTDTWAWDGSTWTELQPAHHPPAGWGNYMATAGGRIVDYTIADYYTPAEHAETWTWTGEDWQQVQTEHAPPALVATAVAGDDSDFVLFGGCTRIGSVCPTSTWVLHNGDWVQAATTGGGPSDRMGAGFVSTGPGQFLLFGGRRLLPGNPVLDDTWKLTISTAATTSADHASASGPGPRYSAQSFQEAVPGNRSSGDRALSIAATSEFNAVADQQTTAEFFGGNMVTAKGKKTSLSYTMVIPDLTCSRARTFQIAGQAGLLASATHRVGVVVREICDDTAPLFQYYEFADGGSTHLPFPVAAGDRLAVSVVSDSDAVTIETTNRTQGWTTSGVYAIDRSGLDHAMLGDIGYLAGSAHPEPVPVPDFTGQRFEQVSVNGSAPTAATTTQVSMVPTYGGPTQIVSSPWRGRSFAPTWHYY